jgi:hypothetical protein
MLCLFITSPKSTNYHNRQTVALASRSISNLTSKASFGLRNEYSIVKINSYFQDRIKESGME